MKNLLYAQIFLTEPAISGLGLGMAAVWDSGRNKEITKIKFFWKGAAKPSA